MEPRRIYLKNKTDQFLWFSRNKDEKTGKHHPYSLENKHFETPKLVICVDVAPFPRSPHFQVPAVCFQGFFSWEKSTKKDEALIIGFTYIRLEISPAKPLSPSCFSRRNPYASQKSFKFDHSAGKKQKQQPQPPNQISSGYHSPSSSCFQGPYTSQLTIALQQSGFLHSAAQHGGWAQIHRAMQQLRPGIPAVQQVGKVPRSGPWCHFPI